MVDGYISKMLEENRGMTLDTALVWAIHAKNALQMVYGYSPYQVVFGANPTLPSTVTKRFFVTMHLLRPRFSMLETMTLETVCKIKLKSFHTTFIEAKNHNTPSLKLFHE